MAQGTLPQSVQAISYKATSMMVEFDNEQQKNWLELSREQASLTGGLNKDGSVILNKDGKMDYGYIGKQLDAMEDSANSAGDALKDQANGEMWAGVTSFGGVAMGGLSLYGVTRSSSSATTQRTNAENFQAELAKPTTASTIATGTNTPATPAANSSSSTSLTYDPNSLPPIASTPSNAGTSTRQQMLLQGPPPPPAAPINTVSAPATNAAAAPAANTTATPANTPQAADPEIRATAKKAANSKTAMKQLIEDYSNKADAATQQKADRVLTEIRGDESLRKPAMKTTESLVDGYTAQEQKWHTNYQTVTSLLNPAITATADIVKSHFTMLQADDSVLERLYSSQGDVTKDQASKVNQDAQTSAQTGRTFGSNATSAWQSYQPV